MKVAQINITSGKGSTGKICVAVSRLLTEKNIDNRIFYSQGTSDYPLSVCYQKPYEIKLNALRSRLLGDWGFEARGVTKRLISELTEYEPDIIHLHNLHGHNIHLGMLFEYIKKRKIKVYWTFHDCWAFTGYCPHYYMSGCDRWQTGCGSCPQKKSYSWLFDRSGELYKKKRALTENLDLTIITPSVWLMEDVKKSFLKDYPVKVINNGIDLDVFKPVKSGFREKYDLTDKKLILGVSFIWGRRKGLDVFLKLAANMPDDWRIVLVGTDEKTDSKLPGNIISIHKTNNQKELAEIYTAADVFVNPTREEVLGLVNIEANACGTPVVTFDTGGSPECVDVTCGIVTPTDDFGKLFDAIKSICEGSPFTSDACRNRSLMFDENVKYREYVDLYLKG